MLCPHRPPCPGCPRFAQPGIPAAAQGRLDELARAHGLRKVSVISGQLTGFRMRARLAIRGRLGSPKLGLFELATHRVVHIPNCIVHHPLINRVASVVRRALVDAEVTSFSDRAHLGLARYMQIVVERSSQSAQVVIVANSATVEPFTKCFELIRERLGADLHSLWFNSNRTRANTILGPDFQNCYGPESVVERFGGPAVHYPPGAFGQSNLAIAHSIIDHVRAQIPQGAAVAEFYAGVGAIGLSVLDKARELRMNELSAQSLHGLDMGIANLHPAEKSKIVLITGSAGKAHVAAFAGSGPDLVIADPPRKGLDLELGEYLAQHAPQRFVYVSCALDSLINDVALLTRHGRLRLADIAAFNLMPFTDHVEVVAVFNRV